jgi:hypothetical protein
VGYFRLECGCIVSSIDNVPSRKCGDHARCTCGSGGHPRYCEKHPERYDQHVAELNHEGELDDARREGKIEALEWALGTAIAAHNNYDDPIDTIRDEIEKLKGEQ